MTRILPSSFYRRDTQTVARELLGCTLVTLDSSGQRVAGRIVETEAYLGVEDKACHTYGGRSTPRTKTMFEEGGRAYVYLIYGMHFCFNVVTREAGEPEAVLIRALEPLEGLEQMKTRRQRATSSRSRASRKINGVIPKFSERALANGPGKLCSALEIDRRHDGNWLELDSGIFIEVPSFSDFEIDASPRIGIAYAEEAADWPLRFSIRGNEYVSKRVRRNASEQ